MAEVKWIKLTTSMFEDEKIDFIESLPEADAILVIWIKLLTQAGKCNSSGFIFLTEKIPYTEEMLAHKFRRPLNVIKLALSTFINLGMIEVSEEGFINISNWEKHQNIDGLEKIRLQNRERQAKFRERQKQLPNKKDNVTSNVTVTHGNATDIDIEEDIDIDNKDIYSLFFSTYNEQEIIVHQKLTAKMKQAINRALKKDKQEDILTAIKRYGEAFRDKKYQFCKYKMTLDKFLTQNNGYYDWLDEGQKWINYSDFKDKGATHAGADKQSSKKDAGVDIAKQAGILSF